MEKWVLPIETGCEALDEVNTERAKRKLKPFLYDFFLTQAAKDCSEYRAKNLIAGHTKNDFEYVPEGGKCTATGCAAWYPEDGWGSCCTFDDYKYAGAAWALGSDGRRYMHLFVR